MVKVKNKCPFVAGIVCYSKMDGCERCPRRDKGSQATLFNIEVKKIEQGAVKRGLVPEGAKVVKQKKRKGVETTIYRMQK